MQQYRKKPVVIEAVQLIDNQKSILECTTFIQNGVKPDHFSCLMAGEYWDRYLDLCKKKGGIKIKTLEGKMLASFGDFIIKGVNGEFYPCKPDIFEKTYEKV